MTLMLLLGGGPWAVACGAAALAVVVRIDGPPMAAGDPGAADH